MKLRQYLQRHHPQVIEGFQQLVRAASSGALTYDSAYTWYEVHPDDFHVMVGEVDFNGGSAGGRWLGGLCFIPAEISPQFQNENVAEVLFSWLAGVFREAGGAALAHRHLIALHDCSRRYDLARARYLSEREVHRIMHPSASNVYRHALSGFALKLPDHYYCEADEDEPQVVTLSTSTADAKFRVMLDEFDIEQSGDAAQDITNQMLSAEAHAIEREDRFEHAGAGLFQGQPFAHFRTYDNQRHHSSHTFVMNFQAPDPFYDEDCDERTPEMTLTLTLHALAQTNHAKVQTQFRTIIETLSLPIS